MVYGVTNDADLVGVEPLEALRQRIPGFTFTTCVAAEASAHPRKGYVTAHIEPEALNGGDVDVYLCGPPPMVEAVRAWLDGPGRHAGEFLLREILAQRRGNHHRRDPPAGGVRQR